MSPDNSQAPYKGSFFTHVNNQSVAEQHVGIRC